MPHNSVPGWESEIHTQNQNPGLINITIQGYLTFKAQVGKRQVSLPAGSSLGDSLALLPKDLGGQFGEQAYDVAGELREHLVVMLNGVHCRHLPDGLGTILKDGDRVAIFPPLAGG